MWDNIAFLTATGVLLFSVYFWVIRARELIETLRRVPLIQPETVRFPLEDLPLISVIVPAHNEQAVISECLTSVLNQDYPRLEVILVDDRSEDLTLQVAREVLAGRENCRIVRIRDLPPGWTGKCHALDTAVRHAKGRWFAFLDADSKLHSAALRRCYEEAVLRRVNMITLSPKFILRTFWEKALQPSLASMACILRPLGKINDAASPVATANGMFFLISRHAYTAIGGHREVRGLAVEDIGIGIRVKAQSLGLLFANGRLLLETRMYSNFRDIIKGWTRILSGSMNYDWVMAFRSMAANLLVSLPAFLCSLYFYIPLARELWPETWFILPGLFAVLSLAVTGITWRQMGVSGAYTALIPLGNLSAIAVFATILKKILFRDALEWRGTSYKSCRYRPTGLEPASSVLCQPASARIPDRTG
jgi:chlorobactene glucosyltransferase